ncbi:MAG: hypothetical protein AUJ49_11270 [Desulfovibrionaceae bacterium CG1_02_65_16]|nr:MAG: hypothetical protein AUJ49_11270 [Desulfovibrionaceae bacterium CG1_02_65_16]
MRSRWKWLAAGVVALLCVSAGLVYASPYLAVRGLRNAAEARDVDGVASRVDFPALRQSLKASLGGRLTAQLRKNPNDPLAAIGLMFGANLVNQLVDAFLTPENIATLMRGRVPDEAATVRKALPFGLSTDFQPPASPPASPGAASSASAPIASSASPGSFGSSGSSGSPASPEAPAQTAGAANARSGEVRMGYEGMNRFTVSLRDKKPGAAPLVLEFQREGILTWKLCAVRLPE